MILQPSNFLSRTKLNLVKRILPCKSPNIAKFDFLDLELPTTTISQVIISSIPNPELSSDYCPERTSHFELDMGPCYFSEIACSNEECGKRFRLRFNSNYVGSPIKIACPQCGEIAYFDVSDEYLINDLTKWIKDQLIAPQIELLQLLSGIPRSAGKIFVEIVEDVPEELITTEEGTRECIHGLKRSWCSICADNEKQDRTARFAKIDIFDLILPVLQPPLGDNFDQAIAFPDELYPFQRTGIKFLIDHKEALLGDEMGLGKTIQAITAARFLFRSGIITNCLILCPRSVLSNWGDLLWKWAPELRVVKVRGAAEQRELLWNSPTHIYLTTYEVLRQDLSSTLKENESRLPANLELFKDGEDIDHEESLKTDIAPKEYGLIILDEIQKIKNPKADITKASRNIVASIRWGLSGTPMENRLEDLISIFAFLKPGLLTYRDADRPWIVKKAIQPYFLRRRKAEAIPELPEKMHEEVWLELSTLQRETYELAEKGGIVALNEKGESVTVQHIFALITKLKQICNIDPVSKESSKLDYLVESLDEITAQGDKALIFSQYPEKTINLIESSLLKYEPFVYHGALTDKERAQIVIKFQEDEKNKILLMSLKSGGLGITLTRACYVFHFDFWWNPSVASQAEDRAHRIGQKKTVFVTSLLTKDTIEDRIQQIIDRKRKLFREVIDDLSDTNLAAVLTKEELYGLFNLRKPEQAKRRTNIKGGIYTMEDIENLSPTDFEKMVAQLYERMGFHSQLTPRTKDKGIDIIAKRVSDIGTELIAVQCKQYPNGVVGVEHARALYGVIQSQQHITKGVLVTSGRFSAECKGFCEGRRLELFDGTNVLGLVEKYNLKP